MSEFREAYFNARNVITKELEERYSFIETYKDNNKLTLDFHKYSLHITFFTPEGVDIDISNHMNEFYNDSFMGLIIKKYPNVNEMGKKLKSLFKPRNHFDSDFLYIYSSLSRKIKFIETEYSELFKIS